MRPSSTIIHKIYLAEQQTEGSNRTLLPSPLNTVYEYLKNENVPIVEA
jgi:hypothetical protein